MNFYPPKINERFQHPKNVGRASKTNAVGTSATFVCGAFLRFTLQIEIETKEIVEAKFQTNGCGYLIAATDVLIDKVVGKKLIELHGLDESVLQSKIEAELGKFSAHRKHCLQLCLQTLQSAFADFRSFQIEEFTGEKSLICTCFGVSEETIEKLVEADSLETVEEVIDACNAGGGCGSCQLLIQEILDVHRREHLDD